MRIQWDNRCAVLTAGPGTVSAWEWSAILVTSDEHLKVCLLLRHCLIATPLGRRWGKSRNKVMGSKQWQSGVCSPVLMPNSEFSFHITAFKSIRTAFKTWVCWVTMTDSPLTSQSLTTLIRSTGQIVGSQEVVQVSTA